MKNQSGGTLEGFKVYDKAIRTFLPHYDEMLQTGVEIIKGLASSDSEILELGSGTGRFSEKILGGLPSATLTLLDRDQDVLNLARERLEVGGDRVRFLKASYFDPLPAADVIVASLSLHYVHDRQKKTELYKAIRQALRPGGVFLCLDACVSRHPRIASLTFNRWIGHMGEHGVTSEEARAHLKSWEKEEEYLPVYDELTALAGAGFDQPECFWRRGPLAIFGGILSDQ